MRRAARCRSIAVLLLASAFPCALSAQTYTPKSIRFESTDPAQHINAGELLRITGLQQGVPLTKADIDAGLQKLADSGAFGNLTYTVNSAALTIRVTPAAGGQALPIRFTNFIWWQYDDLLSILEQRIPLFHGVLPLQGNQTGEVEDALVALLSEKGIPDARIIATPSSNAPGEPMNAVALSITSPEILIGETHFSGAVPAITEKLTTLDHQLADRNFDLREVNTTIRDDLQQILADAGFLNGAIDQPVLSAPRKDLGGYVVDIQVTLHPGPLYRVGSIALHPEPPATDADLRTILPFKTGDSASSSDLHNAVAALALVYVDYGYLLARASATLNKNPSNSTVAYSFTFSPGAQFHLSSIDTSALPTELQQEFATQWHGAPGVVVDKNFQTTLRQALEKLHTRYGIFIAVRPNPAAHTVVILLQLRKLPGVDPAPPDSSKPVQPLPTRSNPVDPFPPFPPPTTHRGSHLSATQVLPRPGVSEDFAQF